MDANHFQGEPHLILDAVALRTNLRTIRRHVAADVKVCAVLKADAYGHGAASVAQAICAIEDGSPFLRVDQFAVATVDEAHVLDEFAKPIMILRPTENAFLGRQRELIEHAVRRGWTMTLCSAAAADDVARIAVHVQKRASVQIMLDTGMTRCGVARDFARLLERTLFHASLKLEGVATHLANSEVVGDPYTAEQLRCFRRTVDEYPILESVPKHACNSGGIFFSPRAHFDLVRPGISLYGIDPTGRPSTDRPLMPIARLEAPILAIHELEPGQTVGYGQSWIAPTKTRIGILPIGYADGYPRLAGNRAITTIQGKLCGVVGRVSMDMIAINLANAPDAVVGDAVTVLDNNPLSPASIYPLSSAADTIPYEILTRIGPRVKRVLVGVEQEEPEDVEDAV
jgi:alanine racemase